MTLRYRRHWFAICLTDNRHHLLLRELRDHLISAARYAFMMRRRGRALDACETYGRAPGVGAQYDPRPWKPP